MTSQNSDKFLTKHICNCSDTKCEYRAKAEVELEQLIEKRVAEARKDELSNLEIIDEVVEKRISELQSNSEGK